MAQYELVILGIPTDSQKDGLIERLLETATDLSLNFPDDVAIRYSHDFADRDFKASTVALYFGGDPTVDLAIIDTLEEAQVPIVPVVIEGAEVSDSIPASIRATNACFIAPTDENLDSLMSVALEILGLLRKQRRVFVSYRRTDSREVAVQLHDQLSGRGFDVFLDTHDIRPGEPFQEMLWHRLADCDVVIMLDTEGYFDSKWTKQELGRTQAKGIQILRIVWPNHSSSRHLSLSDTIQLVNADLTSANQLADAKIEDVVSRTERLRSRSIATRHRDLVGKLRLETERIGGTFEGIGAHRTITCTFPNGLKIHAYPVVGIPTADLLNDIDDKAKKAKHDGIPCLVYDHMGIRPAWLAHLNWLAENITAIRSFKIFEAGWELAEWDS